MPRISQFYGIIIFMFYDDHNPPHFHARYADYEAQISITNPKIIRGYLPPKALGMVIEWAASHEDELLRNWQKAQKLSPLMKIEPLK